MKMIVPFRYSHRIQNGLLRNKSLLERMKTETIDYKQKDTFSFIKKLFPLSSRE
jgi:carboxyl-terminal processing protease